MPRIVLISSSFAVVLMMFWAYVLIAVPLIEPSADPHRGDQVSAAEWQRRRSEGGGRLRELEGLFPKGAWELENPKILESDRVKLLLQDYVNRGDGTVEIRPCTMIFTPDESASGQDQPERSAVVLQAPEGAILRFDQPLDPRRAKVGRLEGGQFLGEITIRSNGKLPDASDDLLIVTRDVDLTQERIATSHPVDFRLGPNYGRGREMQINLLAGESQANSEEPKRALQIRGVESFELRYLERLHLELAEEKPSLQKKPAAEDQRSVADAAVPVEITCRGPFRFNLARQVATFEDQVSVLRIHPVGPSDQLNCELLSIYFVERPNAAGGESQSQAAGGRQRGSGAWKNLRPQRIEAEGHPVVAYAPSQQIAARGERLEYDLQSGQVRLGGSGEVFLSQGPNEIHARELQYTPVPERLGKVVAEGPGWLRGQATGQTERQSEAHWNKRLQISPDQGNSQYQVISLTGGAAFSLVGMGELTAEEIHFWLRESPPEGNGSQPRLQPDRMLALSAARNRSASGVPGSGRDVKIRSSQLSATVGQLNVWFEPDPNRDGPAQNGSQLPIAHRRGGAESWRGAAGHIFKVTGPQKADPPAGEPARAGREYAGPSQDESHFEIVGDLLQAKVSLDPRKPQLSRLRVDGDVRLFETHGAGPDEQPLAVRGDRIEVVDVGGPRSAVTVTGGPAHFEGRGLALTGSNINLDRGSNRLWVDGPGRMELLLENDLEGRPLADAEPVEVEWQDGMTFDGHTVQFLESFAAVSGHRHLRTETLEVSFTQRIDFSSLTRSQTQLKPRQILCRGGVSMENRSFDKRGLLSVERTKVSDLVINLLSGALTAGGPGEVTTVRRGSPDRLAARGPGRLASGQVAAAAGSNGDRLTYLGVCCQGSITGNVHDDRQMTFHDQVQTTYGPVDAWESRLDAEDPDFFEHDGVLLSCRQLTVSEITMPIEYRRTVEMVALGNARAEGRTFTATACRMAYTEAKDLLTLEGDGRTDAELFRQEYVGGPTSRAAARKIRYCPSSNTLNVSDARSLELNLAPAGKSGSP